jgi:hypothetical protein
MSGRTDASTSAVGSSTSATATARSSATIGDGLDGHGEAGGTVDVSGFVTSWRCDVPLSRPDDDSHLT